MLCGKSAQDLFLHAAVRRDVRRRRCSKLCSKADAGHTHSSFRANSCLIFQQPQRSMPRCCGRQGGGKPRTAPSPSTRGRRPGTRKLRTKTMSRGRSTQIESGLTPGFSIAPKSEAELIARPGAFLPNCPDSTSRVFSRPTDRAGSDKAPSFRRIALSRGTACTGRRNLDRNRRRGRQARPRSAQWRLRRRPETANCSGGRGRCSRRPSRYRRTARIDPRCSHRNKMLAGRGGLWGRTSHLRLR